MAARIRVPMIVVAAALLGLIVLLARLQYSWLGQISDAERQRMRATLDARATEFAKDFDQEITRAYLLFQLDAGLSEDNEGERLAARLDRWQATGRYPRLLKDLYRVTRDDAGAMHLFKLNAATRTLEPGEWPASMADWREQIGDRTEPAPGGSVVFRRVRSPIWEAVPAIVVPMPVVMMYEGLPKPDLRFTPQLTYTILALDRDYMTSELLPALATQHFRAAGERVDYQVAVVAVDQGRVVYRSTDEFRPKPDTKVDTTANLFQVRTQDFSSVASEVRRFVNTFTATAPPLAAGSILSMPRLADHPPEAGGTRGKSQGLPGRGVVEGRFEMRAPMSIIVQSAPGGARSEEHTSELQSLRHLVCRLLLEKKKYKTSLMPRQLR